MIDDALLEAMQKAAYRAAYKVLDNGNDAEDVAQDVIAKALTFDIHTKDSPVAFVTTMATNRARTVLKRREREEDVQAGLERPQAAQVGISAAGMRNQVIARVRDALSEKEFAALDMRARGMDRGQIADQLGYANGGAVGVVLSRVRKKLVDKFGGEENLRALLGPQFLYPLEERATDELDGARRPS